MSPVTGVYAQEENSSGIENTTVKGAKGDVSTSGDEDPAVVSEEGENITVEGNVTTTGDASAGVIGENDSNITVNGDIRWLH